MRTILAVFGFCTVKDCMVNGEQEPFTKLKKDDADEGKVTCGLLCFLANVN